MRMDFEKSYPNYSSGLKSDIVQIKKHLYDIAFSVSISIYVKQGGEKE